MVPVVIVVRVEVWMPAEMCVSVLSSLFVWLDNTRVACVVLLVVVKVVVVGLVCAGVMRMWNHRSRPK